MSLPSPFTALDYKSERYSIKGNGHFTTKTCDRFRICTLEDNRGEWYERHYYSQLFKTQTLPQLSREFDSVFTLKKFHVTGSARPICKVHLVAKSPGRIDNDALVDLPLIVKPASESLDFEINRIGLCENRFSEILLRVGDSLVIYVETI